MIASFVAMAPGGVAYTYLGYAGREIAGGSADWVNTALIAIAAVAAGHLRSLGHPPLAADAQGRGRGGRFRNLGLGRGRA